MSTTTTARADTGRVPLEFGRAALQAALTDRFRRDVGNAAHTAGPVVATVGAVDVFGVPALRLASVRAAADVHLTAQAVLIGPWGGDPDAEACGQCLAMRWQRLRHRSEREALEHGGTAIAAGVWPVVPDYVVDAVWSVYQAAVLRRSGAVGRRVAGGWHATADLSLPQVTRIDLETLHVLTFPLLTDPLCANCGPIEAATPQLATLDLVSRPKPDPDRYRLTSTTAYPLATGAMANPVCGTLGAGTWLDVTSPTTSPVTGSVFIRGYAGLVKFSWSGQANSFRTSKDLALLEGLERYAGTHQRRRTEPVVAAYTDLGDTALDPRSCGEYSAQTYRTDPMVEPFAPDRPIPWVWGYSLRDDRPVLVPARLTYYASGQAADNFVYESSNGCAIGSCLEEAILFGLLELIERDAFLLAWYGNAELTEIDLDSCRSPAVRAMVDRAAFRGYDVHAFDTRVDLAVPVVTGLAVRRDGGAGTLSFAAGASLDPETAVEGALSEVLTYIPHLSRQVDERRDELEAMADDYTRCANLGDHPQLFGLPRMAEHARSYLEPAGRCQIQDIRRPGDPDSRDLLLDLRTCQGELERAGFDVIVVDQTTAEQRRMGLRTVSTIVPGLLPIDFGWTRQRALRMPRLRWAARRAGRRTSDLTDADLRMVPHPFP
ncbi:TOMM precursor leader peptide-binding protein [Micromonospora sp. NBC_01813]|uniref:TOMM precursor leader peptide-binding protein n=1 Tax=Micromonospora sp. NBC_01813 TaxID=2975988 RepID=UPI002DDADA0F|nr:TOMM precursor leader peptide-binding protein [Micromonospora sp. NBC_01813]WSA07815.1 TOMM precursor leader peptide-binding protein [Micromonospora sp. NBC_01813]